MERKRALEGIKVIDFSWVVVGPMTINYLADHGATVIKVENHAHPDNSRVIGPYRKGTTPTIDSSGFYVHQNSSKLSVSLDLSKPKGKEIAFKLIKWADVMAESMVPGAMKRLGLDYDSVVKVKPDIIYYSTCMHGQYGPRASSPGYGQLVCALGGIYHLGGWPGRGPAPPEGAYVDYIAPRFGATAILAALDYRRRTGKGQYIDVSQVETAVYLLAPTIMDYLVNSRVMNPNGNRSPYATPHGSFRCKGDDRWCAIAVSSNEEWKAFCKVIGKPSWTKEPKFATLLNRKKNEDELEELVEKWTVNYSPEEVMTLMQAAGVPASVVESNKDLFEDPQLKHRGHFRHFEHPAVGRYTHDSRAFRLPKTPDNQFRAPLMGEHNEYVCKNILGMSDDEISELLAEGVITTEADLPPEWR